MNPLSVTIITLNEEQNIKRCLNSVGWADEIIVVDTGSDDNTLQICRKFGCRTLQTHWRGFGLTKRLAVDSARHDWILSVDADEALTEALQQRIQQILQQPDSVGYRIKRNSFYLNRLIRHCGWNRDYPLRLFNRRFGNFSDKKIHESVEVMGKISRIDEPLLHYTYPTIQSHVARMNRYSELGAEQAIDSGKSATIISAFARGLIKFIKMYLLQQGFLDGKAGLILSCNSAYGVFLKYLKIWEKTR
ncbi:MAG TPA: glycosyltransferase family 2 protein [bacterium]|nr:glycosyltransferase family 2 protein [bacterium]